MKTIIKLLFVAILYIIANQTLAAQDEQIANKLFYAEFAGPGIIMSANMDSRFKPKSRIGLGFRIGAGFGLKRFDDKEVEEGDNERVLRTVYALPVGINYIFGKPNSSYAFEVGGGVSLLSRSASFYDYGIKKEGNMIGFFTFMYRFAPVDGGMSFRVGFTPIIGTAGDLFPMGAIGFGYAF